MDELAVVARLLTANTKSEPSPESKRKAAARLDAAITRSAPRRKTHPVPLQNFATELTGWTDVVRRTAPRRPKRKLLIAALAAALVVAPAAFAFGSRIVDIFEGAPATPAIQANYTRFNNVLSQAMRNRFSAAAQGGVRPVDISQIHGVIAIETSEGQYDLWAAPELNGAGSCHYVQYVNAAAPDTAGGGGGCDPATPINGPYATNISFGSQWSHARASLRIISGYAYGDAASVEIELADGSTLQLPVVEHYFLAAIDADVHVSSVTSYTAAGDQIGEATG